eukprot:9494072-Pyramimonas_sp.AAC.1
MARGCFCGGGSVAIRDRESFDGGGMCTRYTRSRATARTAIATVVAGLHASTPCAAWRLTLHTKVARAQ